MDSLRSFTSATLSNWSFPSYDERINSLAELKDPERFRLPIESELYLQLYRPVLPDVDRGHSTRFGCLLGLGVTWLAILGCLISSVFIIATQGRSCVYETPMTLAGARGASFVINVLLALFTDALGYIHTTSLRWALFRENRLDFNTNTRLFNSTRRSLSNWWPTNVLAIVSLVLCYASTSQIFITGTRTTNSKSTTIEEGFFVNGIAIFALGLGLFGQAAIATWCMIADSRSIPTWSSNPLTNTLAYMHEGLPHRGRRCMISVRESSYSKIMQPSPVQPSAKFATRSVLYVLMLAWILACLAFVWTLALVVSCRNSVLHTGNQFRFSTSWTTVWASPTQMANDQTVSMNPQAIPNRSFAVQIILGLLFTCAVQCMQTISLHCIELIINMSRDEATWRQAYLHSKGASIASLGFVAASSSLLNLVLFSSKAILHWLLGQCLMVSFIYSGNSYGSYNFDMVYMRVFIYGCVVTALAIFSTHLVIRRPRGPQPAAWGHFQTLADLIDDWGLDPAGRLWWGDKGVSNDGIRHAGTSMKREELGDIMMDAVYAGQAKNLILC
ncbi:hypothetical protein N431DRAFT_139141 [Stipitochalara longipes BDJ]|nr:hypothetical protein N431DRAFT_139141 [Stipitochalara longipes BDJ]